MCIKNSLWVWEGFFFKLCNNLYYEKRSCSSISARGPWCFNTVSINHWNVSVSKCSTVKTKIKIKTQHVKDYAYEMWLKIRAVHKFKRQIHKIYIFFSVNIFVEITVEFFHCPQSSKSLVSQYIDELAIGWITIVLFQRQDNKKKKQTAEAGVRIQGDRHYMSPLVEQGGQWQWIHMLFTHYIKELYISPQYSVDHSLRLWDRQTTQQCAVLVFSQMGYLWVPC